MVAVAAVSTRDQAEFNPHFQVGLDVAGRRCLVIGGGAEAGDKTGRLLQAHAAVLVVAPELNRELRAWAAAGRIRHCRRRFRRGDLRGAALVLNTVRSDAALCRHIFALARRRRIPINTFDLPQYSTVAMAALAACGHLRVSISTSNAAPALAGRLRRDLEAIFQGGAAGGEAAGGELEQFLDGLGQLRALARQRASAAERRALLRAQVEGFRLAGAVHLPPEWRQRLAAARRDLERRPAAAGGGHDPQAGDARRPGVLRSARR